MNKEAVADIVAFSIVEASNALKADPLRVATGDVDRDDLEYRLSRSRYYAGAAICKVTGWDYKLIGRLVGAATPANYAITVLQAAKKPWWNSALAVVLAEAVKRRCEESLLAPPPKPGNEPTASASPAIAPRDKLLDALRNTREELSAFLPPKREANPRAPYIPPRTSPTLPGKRALLDELAKAVANTAALPIPEDE